jgi:hypothetical protein
MQVKLLRQFREKVRAGTLSEPPNLEVLRPLKLLDRSAFEHWLWAVDDTTLCSLCGVCEGAPPQLPETLLLPHRVEPVIDRLKGELEDGPPSWARQAPLHYALALAMEDQAELRRVLATVEVRARAGVTDLTHLIMSPTARTRRITGPLARNICGRFPAGRGLRNAARVFLTRPSPLRAGLALAGALAPVLAAEVVDQIRRPGRDSSQLLQRVSDWFAKDGHTLRRAMLQMLKHAKSDSADSPSAFATMVRHVGEDDGLDDLICATLVLRGFLDAVEGPVYTERAWPPGPGMVVRQSPAGDRLAFMWVGRTGEAMVTLNAEGNWSCRYTRSGRPSGAAPLRALALPELIATGLEQAGVRSIEELEKMSDEDLYAVAGVGRTGVAAVKEALRSAAVTLPDAEHATIEGLRRFAYTVLDHNGLDEDALEQELATIPDLPRPILRDLEGARFGTLGEVLRWTSDELGLGSVLSPGRQQRLLVALRAHLAAREVPTTA